MRGKAAEPEAYPYVSCGSILTANELAFFKVLELVINGQWHIFTKVRLEDIINVKKGVERKTRNSFRGRIKSRHIDFVLCDKDTLEILMCIELDDRSHQSAKAQKADQFKNQALKDADLTLVRIPARRSYSEDYLRGHIFEEVTDAEPVKDEASSTPATTQTTTPKLEPVATVPESDDPHARWKSPTDV